MERFSCRLSNCVSCPVSLSQLTGGCARLERWRGKWQEFSPGGKRARGHSRAERLRACVYLSVRVFCSVFGLRRKPSKECVFLHAAIFDFKSRVSLCVCLELHAQLTQHLDIGTVPPRSLLSQLDRSPPFSSDPSPPPSLTPPLLLYSHLHSGPFELPSSRRGELKSLPFALSLRGFPTTPLPPAHTHPVPPSLIVSGGGGWVRLWLLTWTTVGMQVLCVCVCVCVCLCVLW